MCRKPEDFVIDCAHARERSWQAEKTKLNEEIVRLKAELMKRLPEASCSPGCSGLAVSWG